MREKSTSKYARNISYRMSRIRDKDTSIELKLRKALWKRGIRYRKNYKKLIGKPDIAILAPKVAVFCDSSFWHGRNFEDKISKIKTNKEFWNKKLSSNIDRDKKVNMKLEKEGWMVLRFWDEEIETELESVVNKITGHLRKQKSTN